jgi:hypothetical protein
MTTRRFPPQWSVEERRAWFHAAPALLVFLGCARSGLVSSSAAWRNKPAISLSARPSDRIFPIQSTIGATQLPAASCLRSES